MITNKDTAHKLQLELANREHNLKIIEEAIQSNSGSGTQLLEVRAFLQSRIADLRRQLMQESNQKIELVA